MNIYLVKDDVAGVFSMFGTFKSDALAMRSFKAACSGKDVPWKDLSLYRAAGLEENTGTVVPDFDFICRGEIVEI